MGQDETRQHLTDIGAAEALKEMSDPEKTRLIEEYVSELELELTSIRAEVQELRAEKHQLVARVWLNAQVFPDESDRWLERGDRIPEIDREIEELHGRESDIISLLDFGKRHLDAKSQRGSL